MPCEPPARAGPSSEPALHFAIAGTRVRVSAPAPILATIDRMLQHCPRVQGAWDVTVEIEPALLGWRFSTESGSQRYLDRMPIPAVASAAVDAIIVEAARAKGLMTMSGMALAKHGRGLIVRCADEEAEIIAMHLSVRDWRLVSVRCVLLEPASLTAASVRRNFALPSTLASSAPSAYARAIEVSPWYSAARDGLHFFAIDPELVRGSQTWAADTVCDALLDVTGEAAERATVLPLAGSELVDERLVGGRLVLSNPVDACNAIERWLDNLRTEA